MMDEDIEENDNYFKLDKEFQGCESCSLFELYAILKDKITKKNGSEQEINSVLTKTKNLQRDLISMDFLKQQKRLVLKHLT